MKIRQAALADLDAITKIEQLCFTPAQAAAKEAFEKRLRTYPDSFLVAEEKSEIIGFINGCVTNDKTICDEMFSDETLHNPNGDYQAIFGLAVTPERRGKGVAQGLMREFINLTKSRGKKGLILTCEEQLIGFYRAFGYEDLGLSESKHGETVWYDMILEF